MKKYLIALAIVLGTAAPSFAQNFQLLVPFEEGVKLEIYGFDKNRKQIFAEKSPKKTLFDNKGYWIALIDEDKVFSGQFRYFCVRDRRGNWSVPAKVGKGPKDMVCDLRPKDIGRVTFIFVPNRR